MDTNANANVPVTQPDPAPAPQSDAANGTNPEPAAASPATGAQTTDPVAEPKSFDPEIQRFLDNQNIKTDDPYSAISELARRNMKLRSSQDPAPIVKESRPYETLDLAPSRPTAGQLTDLDIANASMYVKQQYPDVTTDADFYKSMIADGFRPMNSAGQLDLRSVMNYASYKQKLADADKAIANAQPKASSIPQPSNTPEYAQVDQVQNMTEQAAQNIVLFSNTEKRYGRPIHPQYQQAVEFLQNMARNGK